MPAPPGAAAPANRVERAVNPFARPRVQKLARRKPGASSVPAWPSSCASQSGARRDIVVENADPFAPAASRMPRFTAAAKPAFAASVITCAPARAATAAESSVLPLSTTITRSIG